MIRNIRGINLDITILLEKIARNIVISSTTIVNTTKKILLIFRKGVLISRYYDKPTGVIRDIDNDITNLKRFYGGII